MKLVEPGAHAPLLLGLILLYPVFVAIALPLVFENDRPWLLWISLLWLCLFLASEVFVVDDIYAGIYDRFNTTLKWWPWIQAGALLVTGAHGIRARSQIYRYGTIIMLLSVCAFGVDLGRALAAPKPEFGRLIGDGAITSDNIEKTILEFLKAQPAGIVLQRPATGAFTPSPALTCSPVSRRFSAGQRTRSCGAACAPCVAPRGAGEQLLRRRSSRCRSMAYAESDRSRLVAEG